ncbi:GNAT family N-acetyltransferase [uncultured Jatrophihabitans sp.]|uniref:GNAT family N-acetyltransferase n=1 Tax=uncultured Jatrophihabitans sp. TaxID=1610747 RepID=UPI0035CA7297
MSTLLDRPVDQPGDGVRVRALGDADRAELQRLLDEDPIVNVVVAGRLRAVRSLDPATFGGVLYGAEDATGQLRAALFAGGNLVPVGDGEAELRALAHEVGRTPRSCSSIVGRDTAVRAVWDVLEPLWGTPRAVRERQPLLSLDRDADLVPADPRVRAMTLSDFDRYMPAAAAMFTEELDISPLEVGAADYQRRIAGLIRHRRAFGIVDDDGSVSFKADIGAVSPHTCQVQGVWVRPDLRGRGLGGAALPAVLHQALALAPTVSLYVNDYNTAACRMYERLGMRQVATLRTLLF